MQSVMIRGFTVSRKREREREREMSEEDWVEMDEDSEDQSLFVVSPNKKKTPQKRKLCEIQQDGEVEYDTDKIDTTSKRRMRKKPISDSSEENDDFDEDDPELRCNERRGTEYDKFSAQKDPITLKDLDDRHIEWISPDENLKICYNISTLISIAVSKGGLMQPPHFRDPMGLRMRCQIIKTFPEFDRSDASSLLSDVEKSNLHQNPQILLDKYFESHQKDFEEWARNHMGNQDLVLCPVCYHFLCERSSDMIKREDGEDEYAFRSRRAAHAADKNPLDVISYRSREVGSLSLKLTIKDMISHLRNVHNISSKLLYRKSGINTFLKSCKIRATDGMLQRFLGRTGQVDRQIQRFWLDDCAFYRAMYNELTFWTKCNDEDIAVWEKSSSLEDLERNNVDKKSIESVTNFLMSKLKISSTDTTVQTSKIDLEISKWYEDKKNSDLLLGDALKPYSNNEEELQEFITNELEEEEEEESGDDYNNISAHFVRDQIRGDGDDEDSDKEGEEEEKYSSEDDDDDEEEDDDDKIVIDLRRDAENDADSELETDVEYEKARRRRLRRKQRRRSSGDEKGLFELTSPRTSKRRQIIDDESDESSIVDLMSLPTTGSKRRQVIDDDSDDIDGRITLVDLTPRPTRNKRRQIIDDDSDDVI